VTGNQLVAISLKALERKEAVSFTALRDIDHWQELEVARKKFAESVVTTGVPVPRYAEPS
jgi:hypothetical protein